MHSLMQRKRRMIVWEYTFDKQGRLLARKDRNGNTDRFVYNSSGQLCEARGANGGILYYRYNKEGNLYHVSDHTGREVRLRYSYRVLQQYINPSGQAYTYQYNENLRLESVITPRGIEGVRNVYDGANRVISQTLPDGARRNFSMMMRENAPAQETRTGISLPTRAMTNSAISVLSIKTAKSAMRTMTTTREPYMSIRTAIRPGTAMMSREI